MIKQTVVTDNLTQARKAYGLSQIDLAKRCNLTTKDIDDIEHGKLAISPDVVIQIADALNCNPCDLLLYITSEH